MSWIYILGIVVVFVAVAALFGIKPQGTRHIAGTRMMAAARIVLVVVLLILVLAWWMGR